MFIGNDERVDELANKYNRLLNDAGITTYIDNTDKTPGFKFAEAEVNGIPVRIEIGPKDIENGEVVVVRRNDREKITVKIKDVAKELPKILESIQSDMFKTAKKFLDSHIFKATNVDEMKEIANNNIGFIKAMWCGEEACEDEIKAATGGYGSRCIDEEHEHLADKCVFFSG
mgnify:CR=1 FL=1